MKSILSVLLIIYFVNNCVYAQAPKLLLAKNYHSDIHLADYWISEKLDGVRAYWDGKKLISRQGKTFNAPQWFVRGLPDSALDGELWIARQQFDTVSGLVRRQANKPSNWQHIKYMIFDLPHNPKPFDQRILDMQAIVAKANIPHLKMIPQFKLSTHQELTSKLDDIVQNGGEGLMLHRGSSLYKSGRSNDLLKLKKYFDAEATVIKHIPGKGKYKQILGALLVETPQGIQFKIGTGFSDLERANPPAIGSLITYKYFGLSNKGTPRFASFLRVRQHN